MREYAIRIFPPFPDEGERDSRKTYIDDSQDVEVQIQAFLLATWPNLDFVASWEYLYCPMFDDKDFNDAISRLDQQHDS